MQYRNMTTVLTREYLDARPDGWLDYAAKRIAQLYGSTQLCLVVLYMSFWFVIKQVFYTFVSLVAGEQKNAITGPFVKNTWIWFYQQNPLFILDSSADVQLLETQEIS